MTRLLVCIPFLLFFALIYRFSQPELETGANANRKAVLPQPSWLTLLNAPPCVTFPGNVPWAGMFHATNTDPYQIEPLPEKDIIVFLEKCLERYDREVKGYRVVLHKQEKMKNEPRPRAVEVIQASFRDKPHSVHMTWRKGRRIASQVLYVEGENNDCIVVKPIIYFGLFLYKKLDDPLVKSSGRINIDEFGMKKGMVRALKAWKEGLAKDYLKVKYEGVYEVREAGNRLCYKLHRDRSEDPDSDGVTDVVLYIDKETWLQVGSVVRDINGKLVGEYYFRDIELNPEFPEDYFKRSLLTKK